MSEYKKRRAKKHKVTHEFSGRLHFFKVESDSGESHSVTIQAGCDCRYMSTQGTANGSICSHVLAVLNLILESGNIRLKLDQDMIQARRNSCIRLVRRSNRVLNEVRVSVGESIVHQNKKVEICRQLAKEEKHFITEAIFEKGDLRADILVLDDFKVIEIAVTETDESLDKKRIEYEKIGLKFEVIRC